MAKKFEANETIVALDNVLAEDLQETALAALRNVVIGTPVGDPTIWQNPASAPPGYVGGHARRNWNVSIDAPTDAVVGTAGRGPGKTGATNDAISRGEPIIRGASPRRTRRIIVQNAVPYIGRLNNGHSEQAPVNFVQKAVQAAGQVVGNQRKDVP